jgi:L-iditol 2-dehydrogenase
MKALRFNATIPRYAATKVAGRFRQQAYYKGPFATTYLDDVPEPELTGDDWVKVRTTYGGVCGSDINLIFLKDSPYSEPYTTMPVTIGHENVGVIAEAGEGVEGYSAGDRVVVDPMLPCAARGIDPPCERCARGDFSQCLRMREGSLPPGFYTGFTGATGGSWSELFLAHQSQLLKVPDGMADEEALMLEAFTVPLHAIMRNLPAPGDTVLVYGCGVIGMLSVASLKALAPRCRVIAVARYPFQAEVVRGYGADEIIMQREVKDFYGEVARLTGAQVVKPMIGGRYLNGGPDMVLECVGSPATLDDSLRMTKSGGTVVLIGLVSFAPKIDWTPVWFKELKVTGTLCSSSDSFEGTTARTIEWARDLVTGGQVRVDHLLTHTWKLDQFEDMIETALSKGNTGCIKQAFRF